MIAKVHGCEPVEFLGLVEISFHEPGLSQVIINPSVGRMKVDRSLKRPDGLVRLFFLDKEATLLHELQRSHAARTGSCLDLKPFLFLRQGFRRGDRDRRGRRGAPRKGEAQDGQKQELKNS
jgi:hypothetical protein